MTRNSHNLIFVSLSLGGVAVALAGLVWIVIVSTAWKSVVDFLAVQPVRELMFFGGLVFFLVIVPIGKICERFIKS